MLHRILQAHASAFHPVVELPDQLLRLDLSSKNPIADERVFFNTATFHTYINALLSASGAMAAVGGYNENRVIYQRSNHFAGQEPRSVHLGIDIWTAAGTAVYAPLESTVHSFADNNRFGDYGPTIVLCHTLDSVVFYTLYGHLSRKSLDNLHEGQTFAAGEKIGEIGNFPENGDWPPHLHFQIIAHMQGMKGDFSGVTAPSQREHYLKICPDPNLILQLPILNTPNS